LARIGLLGGTFNPPHTAHLLCAQEAAVALDLESVRLIPANVPPHKQVPEDPGVEVRIELCRLASEGDPLIEVSRIEADREGPSFTADTLRALHDAEPEHQLTFIVGADMARSLPRWREPEAILDLATLAVASREGVERDDVIESLSGLSGVPERVRFFDMPRFDVSSTMIRRRAAQGLPIRHLVPDAVAAFVESRGLYRVGSRAWTR
jgi:nicotinate-nucleotide adenylyltransferase